MQDVWTFSAFYADTAIGKRSICKCGIQHYESSEFFGGEEKFKKQKEHDRLKKEYAKKHGYKLIIIKYTYDSYESISEYMAKELKK